MRHGLLLNAQSLEHFLVAHVIRSVFLHVVKEYFGAGFFHDEGAAVLKTISGRHVAAEIELLGAIRGRPRFRRQHGREELKHVEALEAQRFVRFAPVVDVKFAIEELSRHKFLNADFLESDSDEADVFAVEDWLEGRDLPGGQPTKRSSEAAEEDKDAALFGPQGAVSRVRMRRRRRQQLVGRDFLQRC